MSHQVISTSTLDQAQLNRIWSATLLEELTRFGVEHVCIAPGSRSTPLAIESELNAKLTLHTHFDERGLGFFALGIAKALESPVAIIVTSGTAVANLLPAVVEANLTGEKLILLTADRPQQLVSCGANQAIVQANLFSHHVVSEVGLPSPSASIELNWLLCCIDESMNRQAHSGGPVHINCPFPEPLYSKECPRLSDIAELPQYWLSASQPYTQQSVALQDQPTLPTILAQNSAKKGLVIIGKLDHQEAMAVIELSRALGWPVLCDPQSGVTSQWASYDVWLQNDEAALHLAKCEFIVQFGARLVSKRLLHFIDQQTALWSPSDYVLVSTEPGRLNPSHRPMTRLQDIAINISVAKGAQAGWADNLKVWPKRVAIASSALFTDHVTELEIAHRLPELTKGFDLFLGNSLGVRLVDMVCQVGTTKVYSNRGASGIDGIIATSAGASVGSSKPVLTLLGDTSLLHDLNSLALMRHQSNIILVVNNDGGAIFDMLPVDACHKQKLYQMPHGYHFKHAAQQFGLSYCQPQTWNELLNAVKQHNSSTQTTLLIEVVTPSGEASAHIKALSSAIKG